jgi:aromatic-L-amino-acid decarboxylase
MGPAEFRRYGQQAVELVARYLEGLDDIPPLPPVASGDVLAALPLSPPEEGEELGTILEDVETTLLPASTHWNHPRFFAYFNSTSAAAGILGELLAAGVNANAMLWRTGPAATELEYLTCRWLAELLGLPASFDGHINDTASTSTLVALGAARHRAAPEARERGLSGLAPLRVYGSTQAHSSVEKAVVALGMGRQGYRPVACDPEFRMIPGELERAIDGDLRAGLIPCAVVATAGTTATTSVDPIPAIAEIASRHQLWLHVDAAHGGVAAMLPERRWVLEGADRADSLVVNPHKWLFTPMDCSVLFTPHPESIRQAFSLVPAYLETPESGRGTGLGSRNLMDFGLALGRRQRALKLWMVIRYFGRSGLQRLLRSHLQMADWLRRQLEAGEGWEVMAPVPLATVCFRHHPEGAADEPELEAHNREVMRLVNDSGEAFISHAAPDGRFLIRATIGGLRTTQGDVERLFAALQLAAARAA